MNNLLHTLWRIPCASLLIFVMLPHNDFSSAAHYEEKLGMKV